jgi:hypothetical protein
MSTKSIEDLWAELRSSLNTYTRAPGDGTKTKWEWAQETGISPQAAYVFLNKQVKAGTMERLPIIDGGKRAWCYRPIKRGENEKATKAAKAKTGVLR